MQKISIWIFIYDFKLSTVTFITAVSRLLINSSSNTVHCQSQVKNHFRFTESTCPAQKQSDLYWIIYFVDQQCSCFYFTGKEIDSALYLLEVMRGREHRLNTSLFMLLNWSGWLLKSIDQKYPTIFPVFADKHEHILNNCKTFQPYNHNHIFENTT